MTFLYRTISKAGKMKQHATCDTYFDCYGGNLHAINSRTECFPQARYWFLVYAITLTNSISSNAPLNNLAITNNDIIGYCCESKGLRSGVLSILPSQTLGT